MTWASSRVAAAWRQCSSWATRSPGTSGEAKTLYSQTCEAGVAADCYRLAQILKRENAKATRETFTLYSKACKGDVAQGCFEVGKAWEAARDPVKALPFYKKACAAEHNPACSRVRRLEQ